MVVGSVEDVRDRIWTSVDRALHGDKDVGEPFIVSKRREKESGTGLILALAATATTLGTVFPAGYNLGALNSPQQVMMAFCNESISTAYSTVLTPTLLELVWSVVVSIFLVGGGAGALSAGHIANKIGRKKTLISICLLNIVGALLFATCKLAGSVEMLLLGRLIVGFSGGMSTSFMPLYMSEIATPCSQSALGILGPVGLTLGLFIGQVISLQDLLGNESGWTILLALSCAPAVAALLMYRWIPESPHFLFAKGKSDEAVQELCRLRSRSAAHLEQELDLLRRGASSDGAKGAGGEKEEWSLLSLYRNENLRWPFICSIVMHIGNQLSGINAVFYYSTGFFQSAGLDKKQAEYALVGAGFINFFMCGSTMYLTSRFARRSLMFCSSLGVVLFLVVQTVSIMYIDEAVWVPWLCIASLMLYIVFFEIGIGPLPFYLPSELIPAGPRPLVMSFGCMINWATNFLVGMTFPLVQSILGVYTFAIFIVAMILQLIFLFFKLPETHQK